MTRDELVADLKSRLEAEPNAVDELNVLTLKMGFATHHVFTPTYITALIAILEA